MQDIVLESKNMNAMIDRAILLGLDSLLVVTTDPKSFKVPNATSDSSNMTISSIANSQKKGSCVQATPLNVRKLVEHVKPKFIYGIESQMPKDYIHQRGSGLNHIICKLMHKNKITYVFDFSQLLKFPNMRAKLLGRMRQNVVLCQKYKVAMRIATFAADENLLRSPQDLKSLFSLLGLQAHELKAALESTN